MCLKAGSGRTDPPLLGGAGGQRFFCCGCSKKAAPPLEHPASALFRPASVSPLRPFPALKRDNYLFIILHFRPFGKSFLLSAGFSPLIFPDSPIQLFFFLAFGRGFGTTHFQEKAPPERGFSKGNPIFAGPTSGSSGPRPGKGGDRISQPQPVRTGCLPFRPSAGGLPTEPKTFGRAVRRGPSDPALRAGRNGFRRTRGGRQERAVRYRPS